ncbi:MAG TPA: family 1 glycosylhydrolase [Actinomycetota bacterium]|nr:family 1 glycosylhydrolase [Actinomycetota bacterium]
MGINVYKPGWYVEPPEEPPGYRDIPINAYHPKMQSAWHVLDPEVMYWAPRHMRSIWGARSIFITENGCAAADVVAEDGRVHDSDRVMFLRACLGQLSGRPPRGCRWADTFCGAPRTTSIGSGAGATASG